MTRQATISYRFTHLPAIIIFFIAFALRLIFLFEFSSIPLFNTPIMDMLYHHQWALDILAGHGDSYVPFFRAPLYPYFLAGIYAIFGVDFWVIRIIQALMGSFGAVLVYLIGKQTFSQKSGIIAGLIYAVWGTAIFYDGQLLIPSLAIFLNLLSLYFLTKAIINSHTHSFLLGGLFLGLSAIARPTVLLFAVILFLWLLWHLYQKRAHIKVNHILIFALATTIPIFPVTVYNYVQSGEFTLTGTYGGLNFYLGNNNEADGISAILPGARQDWWGMLDDAERFAESESGRRLTPAEQSRFWFKKGLHEITGDPLRFIGHLVKKSIYLIQGIELSNNFDFYYFTQSTFITKILIWRHTVFLPWGLFFPLAIIGLIAAARRNDQSWILALFFFTYVIAVVLFFVTARYRLPMVPILALFAAEALVQIVRLIKEKRVNKLLFVFIIFLPLFLITNIDFFHHAKKTSAPGLFTMATLYQKQGDYPKAEKYYRLSIAADSTFAQAYNDLGILLTSQGIIKEALSIQKQGLAGNTEFLPLQYNLGYTFLILGQPDSALPLLRSVLVHEPGNIDNKNMIGWAFSMKKQYDSALIYYKDIVDAGAPFPHARYNLGSTYLELGLLDSAFFWLNKSLEVDSTYAETYYNLARVWMQRHQKDSAIVNLKIFLTKWSGGSAQAVYVRQLIDSLKRQR